MRGADATRACPECTRPILVAALERGRDDEKNKRRDHRNAGRPGRDCSEPRNKEGGKDHQSGGGIDDSVDPDSCREDLSAGARVLGCVLRYASKWMEKAQLERQKPK